MSNFGILNRIDYVVSLDTILDGNVTKGPETVPMIVTVKIWL